MNQTAQIAKSLNRPAMRHPAVEIETYPEGKEAYLMGDYRSWRPRYRAMCPEPGPQDLFLLVLIDGRRATIQHAADHARWRVAAERLAESQRCQVKVLPMSGAELLNFLGIAPAAPQPLESMDPAFREQAVRNCMDVLRECGSQEDREQALELLSKLGAVQ